MRNIFRHYTIFRNKLLYRLALFLGFKPKKVQYLLATNRYLDNRATWLAKGGKITKERRILSDFTDSAGTAHGHYFHQDLLVASFIYEAKPYRHIDIGSRIDGFVAHVAVFRPIEVMDIRPLDDILHENIKFFQCDLMQPFEGAALADSISCLHAIEHFGLGRYGDPIDVKGYLRGFSNLVAMLKPRGRLYISFPIANHDKVYFNAHRIFAPTSIFAWPNAERLTLKRFDYIGSDGILVTDIAPEKLSQESSTGCGIYSFEKN